MGQKRRKIVKLTENDIERIVKKVVKESSEFGNILGRSRMADYNTYRGGEGKKLDNYMFFQNLREIRSNINTLLNMDENEVDRIISDGHDWASEHIATAKDDIEEVTSFLEHRDINENDFSWSSVLGDSDDKWDELEKDINTCIRPLVSKYENKFGNDSYRVIDAIYQVLDGMFKKV